jgi:radical SAM-linked protein
VAILIEEAWKRGATFDGWSEHRDFRAWEEALSEQGESPEEYFKEREEQERFPWEVLDWSIDRDYFLAERRSSRDADLTADCKNGPCSMCGVCDFDRLENVYSEPLAKRPPETAGGILQGVPGTTVRMRYRKGEEVRFLSHLDMMRELERTMRRASVPVLYSEGYSPHPKVSAGPPLPLGWTSTCEWIDVELAGEWSKQRLTDLLIDLNATAVRGVEFLEAAAMPPTAVSLNAGIAASGYVARFPSPPFHTNSGELTEQMGVFLSKESVRITRQGKKRSSEIDIRPMVQEFEVVGEDVVFLRLMTADGKTVRPTEVLRVVLGLEEDRVPLIQIEKSDSRFATGDLPTSGALVRTEVEGFETRNTDFSSKPTRDSRGDSGGRPPS